VHGWGRGEWWGTWNDLGKGNLGAYGQEGRAWVEGGEGSGDELGMIWARRCMWIEGGRGVVTNLE
jgi:hypothetical protein